MSDRDGRDLAALLVDKARGDEAALERLAPDPAIPDELLGFHAQQAVEKRLTAVLACNAVEYERTHNIAYLVGLLADNELPVPPSPGPPHTLDALTPSAAEFRYGLAPTESLDRERMLETVRALRDWSDAQLAP